MGAHETLLGALWLFVPAYFGNMAPVFAMKILPRLSAPIDGGKNWKDGRRVLGAGKTWRGLVAGGILGALFALLQADLLRFQPYFDDFGLAEGGYGVPLILGYAMGLGAVVGDAAKSFFKRRTGRQGGQPWIPFDQLDFVVGGLAFAALAAWILHAAGATATNWFADAFLGSEWPRLAILLLLTPLLHFLVNVLGYKLKLKDVPW